MAMPLAALWPLWRFLAGVASAFVFVFVSGWCLARLSALGTPALAGRRSVRARPSFSTIQ